METLAVSWALDNGPLDSGLCHCVGFENEICSVFILKLRAEPEQPPGETRTWEIAARPWVGTVCALADCPSLWIPLVSYGCKQNNLWAGCQASGTSSDGIQRYPPPEIQHQTHNRAWAKAISKLLPSRSLQDSEEAHSWRTCDVKWGRTEDWQYLIEFVSWKLVCKPMFTGSKLENACPRSSHSRWIWVQLK